MLALIVAEGLAIVILGLLVAGLLRSHAEILRALHQLGAGLDPDADRAGTPGAVPITVERSGPDSAQGYDITGETLDGEVAALALLGAPQATLLAFLSSGCATCAGFWAAFADAGLDIPGAARLVLLARDATEESVGQLRELAPDRTLVLSSAAWAQYGVPASPYFIYLDGPTGRVIGEGTAGSWPQVAALLRQAIGDAATARPATRPAAAGGARDPDSGPAIDRELLRAGIGPGHPSLYPTDTEAPVAEAKQ